MLLPPVELPCRGKPSSEGGTAAGDDGVEKRLLEVGPVPAGGMALFPLGGFRVDREVGVPSVLPRSRLDGALLPVQPGEFESGRSLIVDVPRGG